MPYGDVQSRFNGHTFAQAWRFICHDGQWIYRDDMYRVRIANNTMMERDYNEANRVHIRLHDTRIITYRRDGLIELNTGGFHTRITASRFEQFARASVSFRGGEATILCRAFGNPMPFTDGMTVREIERRTAPRDRRRSQRPAGRTTSVPIDPRPTREVFQQWVENFDRTIAESVATGSIRVSLTTNTGSIVIPRVTS